MGSRGVGGSLGAHGRGEYDGGERGEKRALCEEEQGRWAWSRGEGSRGRGLDVANPPDGLRRPRAGCGLRGTRCEVRGTRGLALGRGASGEGRVGKGSEWSCGSPCIPGIIGHASRRNSVVPRPSCLAAWDGARRGLLPARADAPVDQRFGLASQIQRAAVSIPANIAEGHCRRHRADYARHLSVARGSLGELETHLLLTERLGLLSHSTLVPALALADQLGRMLFTLHLRLTTKARTLPSPHQTPRTSHPAPRT